ncbi:MAG: hypothetical protein WKG07_30845 [Hymenobacter sp.]
MRRFRPPVAAPTTAGPAHCAPWAAARLYNGDLGGAAAELLEARGRAVGVLYRLRPHLLDRRRVLATSSSVPTTSLKERGLAFASSNGTVAHASCATTC